MLDALQQHATLVFEHYLKKRASWADA